MAEWKLEQEEYYYKLYDSKNELAGYFQPDYGKIFPKEKEEEIIEEMLKRQDHVYGGLLYVPMLKLNLAEDADYDLDQVIANLEASVERVKQWKDCLRGFSFVASMWSSKSHTDPDMLAIMMEIKFSDPVRLNKDDILEALRPMLGRFTEKQLL